MNKHLSKEANHELKNNTQESWTRTTATKHLRDEGLEFSQRNNKNTNKTLKKNKKKNEKQTIFDIFFIFFSYPRFSGDEYI